MDAILDKDWNLTVIIANSEALRALEGETISTRINGQDKVELKTSHRFEKWNPKKDSRTFEQYLAEYRASAKQKQIAIWYGNDVFMEIPQAALMFNYKRYYMNSFLDNLKINASEDIVKEFKQRFPEMQVVVEVDYSK